MLCDTKLHCFIEKSVFIPTIKEKNIQSVVIVTSPDGFEAWNSAISRLEIWNRPLVEGRENARVKTHRLVPVKV